jgi:hypothetical protein
MTFMILLKLTCLLEICKHQMKGWMMSIYKFSGKNTGKLELIPVVHKKLKLTHI